MGIQLTDAMIDKLNEVVAMGLEQVGEKNDTCWEEKWFSLLDRHQDSPAASKRKDLLEAAIFMRRFCDLWEGLDA